MNDQEKRKARAVDDGPCYEGSWDFVSIDKMRQKHIPDYNPVVYMQGVGRPYGIATDSHGGLFIVEKADNRYNIVLTLSIPCCSIDIPGPIRTLIDRANAGAKAERADSSKASCKEAVELIKQALSKFEEPSPKFFTGDTVYLNQPSQVSLPLREKAVVLAIKEEPYGEYQYSVGIKTYQNYLNKMTVKEAQLEKRVKPGKVIKGDIFWEPKIGEMVLIWGFINGQVLETSWDPEQEKRYYQVRIPVSSFVVEDYEVSIEDLNPLPSSVGESRLE